MTVGGMSCREAVALATDYMEGVLVPELTRRLEEHLPTCVGCQRYFEQLRVTVEALGRLARDEMPPGEVERLIDLYRQSR